MGLSGSPGLGPVGKLQGPGNRLRGCVLQSSTALAKAAHWAGPRPWGSSDPLPIEVTASSVCLGGSLWVLPLPCGQPEEAEGQLSPRCLAPPVITAINFELPLLSWDLTSEDDSLCLGIWPFLVRTENNICLVMHAKSLQLCPALCDPMNCSPTGSSFHRISRARILEWVPMPSSRGSSQPRDQACISYVSCIGRQVLYH